MNTTERKAHWEKIYKTKKADEVSWFQPVPETSLKLIDKLNLAPSDRIIDIGGGDSFLTDHLLDAGFENLSVLDVSSNAIARAQERLGHKSALVDFIVSDIVDFDPPYKFDLWHDRAVLHFLTKDEEVRKYVEIIESNINSGGHVIIGVFSTDGPTKCSGIEIRQYNEESMRGLLGEGFEIGETFRVMHQTPFDTAQNFIFSVYTKIR
jgi:predicted TPR repeat methyltransferase